MAVYPVLVPLYLAQFTVTTVELDDPEPKDVTVTAFMDASTPDVSALTRLEHHLECAHVGLRPAAARRR